MTCVIESSYRHAACCAVDTEQIRTCRLTVALSLSDSDPRSELVSPGGPTLEEDAREGGPELLSLLVEAIDIPLDVLLRSRGSTE